MHSRGFQATDLSPDGPFRDRSEAVDRQRQVLQYSSSFTLLFLGLKLIYNPSLKETLLFYK